MKRRKQRKTDSQCIAFALSEIYEYVLDLFAHLSLRSSKNVSVFLTIFRSSLFAHIIFHLQGLFSLAVAPLGFSDCSPSLFLCSFPLIISLSFSHFSSAPFSFSPSRCSSLQPALPSRWRDLEPAQITAPIPYLRNTGQENASGKIRTNLEIVSVHKSVSAIQEKARHNACRIYRMQMQYRYA